MIIKSKNVYELMHGTQLQLRQAVWRIFLFLGVALMIFPWKLAGQSLPGNLGAYYFDKNNTDIADYDVKNTRFTIPWSQVQPDSGVFDWDASVIHRIERCIELGIPPYPVFRATDCWAVQHPNRPGASAPPLDLQTVWDEDYGYSQTYYTFIYEVVNRFQGVFPAIIIENEDIAQNFWSGTQTEYFLLLATAAKAAHDADPSVKVGNSGLPSTAIGYVIAQDLIDQGLGQEAFEFFHAYYRDNFAVNLENIQTIDDLIRYLEHQAETIQEIENNFLVVPQIADIFVFHFYETTETYDEVIAFLRAKTNNMPLINNEMGPRVRLEESNREIKAAQKMVEKCIVSRAFELEAVTWFTVTNDTHFIVGIFDEGGNPIPIMINAFGIAMELLNKDLMAYEDMSGNGIQRHSFTFSDEVVNVVWSNEDGHIITVPGGSQAYDIEGNLISDPQILLTPYAVYVVTPLTNINEDQTLPRNLPNLCQLNQNRPNPFTLTTTLSYVIHKPTLVTLELYDITGQRVRTLVDGIHGPGDYEVIWDGTNEKNRKVSNGIYFVKMHAGEFISTRKILLLKKGG